MKNTTTIRRMMATIAIIFAVATTSCKKENEVTPNNNGNQNNNTPAVSMKPKNITTIENGATVRTQTYQYDAQKKLTKYSSSEQNVIDELLINNDGISVTRTQQNVLKQTERVIFNADKSLRQIVSTSDNSTSKFFGDFSTIDNSGISALTSIINENLALNQSIGFGYTEGNLTAIGAGTDRVAFTYFNNLTFQKGINELPVSAMSLRYHKIIEQEDMASYKFSSKLISTITVTNGAVIKIIRSFVYTQDAQGRVTNIFESISFPARPADNTRLQHVITY